MKTHFIESNNTLSEFSLIRYIKQLYRLYGKENNPKSTFFFRITHECICIGRKNKISVTLHVIFTHEKSDVNPKKVVRSLLMHYVDSCFSAISRHTVYYFFSQR